ncbi:MAG: PAC2 family protein [Chloroflexota bacterium]
MREPLKFLSQLELPNSSLIIGWGMDASRLGWRVINHLKGKLNGQSFIEVEPVDFFALGGVAVHGDQIQFPESKFYACPQNALVLLGSTPPASEHYKFLNLILEVAQQYCHVQEIYILGGMVALSAHTLPRELRGTFNSPELKSELSAFNLAREWDYETPPGQRPTLNSFLLWAAKRRNIPAVSLWAAIPFYLTTVNDVEAERRVLEFFNNRFNLGMDFSDLDEEISRQNQAIARVRAGSPDVDESIRKLENNLSLGEEETQKLIKEIDKVLGERK